VVQRVHGDGTDHHDFLTIFFENEDHVEIFQLKLDTFKMNQLDVFKCNDEWRLQKKFKKLQKASSWKRVLESEFLKASSRKRVLESEFSKANSRERIIESEFSKQVLESEFSKASSRKRVLKVKKITAHPAGQIDEASSCRLKQDSFPKWNTMVPQFPKGLVKINGILGDSFDLFAETLECRFKFVPQFTLSLFSRQIVTIVHMLMFSQIGGYFTNFSVELDINLFLLSKQNGILENNLNNV
jgi:hypothetical protein